MASEQLAVVLDHLRFVARSTFAPERGADERGRKGGGLVAMRRMTEIYPMADRSCGDLVTTVTPIDVDGTPGEWHTTVEADPSRRLLYLHGGGWMAGSLGSHRSLVSAITRAFGGVTLAIDYRLAPEHPFPAGLDDCVAAYHWIRANGPNGAEPADGVTIAGDSAGGNLTLATCLVLRDGPAAGPDAAVVISPLTDFSGTAESRRTRRDVDPIIPAGGLEQLGAAYTQGKVALDDPRIAPLHGELAGLPPLLIHVGDSEVLLSDSTEFAAKAERAGVTVTLEVWDRMPHVFHFFTPFLPEADEAIARIGAFLAPSGPAGRASPHVI